MIATWCTLAAALAGDPPETGEAAPAAEASAPDEVAPPPLVVPEAGRVALPDPGDLASALDDPSVIDDPEGEGFASVLDAWMAGQREVWGGRTLLKPLLSVRSHPSGTPVQLGLAVGRQWWQLRDGPRALLEAVLTGEATAASGRGSWAADLTVLGGVAVGPLGASLGAAFVGDRTVLGPVDLGTVASLAPVGQLTVDLDLAQLYGSAAPRFFVAGERASAVGVPIGDEPVVRGGVGVSLGAIRLSADWTGRWTVADRIDRFGVGLRYKP